MTVKLRRLKPELQPTYPRVSASSAVLCSIADKRIRPRMAWQYHGYDGKMKESETTQTKRRAKGPMCDFPVRNFPVCYFLFVRSFVLHRHHPDWLPGRLPVNLGFGHDIQFSAKLPATGKGNTC